MDETVTSPSTAAPWPYCTKVQFTRNSRLSKLQEYLGRELISNRTPFRLEMILIKGNPDGWK